MCLTASDEARQGPPKQCNQGKSKERQPANSAAKQTVQRCKSGSAEARSVQERKRQQCMSEDKTSDRQRKSSVRRYMLQVTSTAIIKECCAFKYCTDRMLREAPAEIEGLRTLDDSQKSSNRMKLGVVSASMYACSTGRDVPAKNPWRAFFEPWPTRGREHPSRDAGRPCMHAHWEPKDPSDRGHAPARWISHSQKKCLQAFVRTFPRPARSLSNPPKMLPGFLWTRASAAMGSFRAPHACEGPAEHPPNTY